MYITSPKKSCKLFLCENFVRTQGSPERDIKQTKQCINIGRHDEWQYKKQKQSIKGEKEKVVEK